MADLDARAGAVREVEGLLLDPAAEHMVELVLSRLPDATLRAASHRGMVEFTVDADGVHVRAVSGEDPLSETDPHRFLGREAELAAGFPAPAENAYPYAHDQIAQFFASPFAPDLAVVHTAAHRFHGNAGEHGSLGVVQARAPFIASGAGVPSRGLLDGHARMIDVAPTLCALGGLPTVTGRDRWGGRHPGAFLARQDGAPVAEVLDGNVARHVVAFLWDGTNANLLHAAIEDGDAPHAALLLERGTGLRGGVVASFPTATLANHHTALTGAHPGHSGILHNTWFDRAVGETRDLLELDQMVRSRDHVDPAVDTVHTAFHRGRPGAFTVTTYEFCDRGADWSTFTELAERRRIAFPREDDVFDRDESWYQRSGEYRWMSRVDEAGARQAAGFWDDGAPLPDFAWFSFALTDSASHEGGPHSPESRAAVRDTDRRMGEVIAAVEQAGVIDETAFVVLADHGMQLTDEANTDDLADVLTESPHAHELVDSQFVYLT